MKRAEYCWYRTDDAFHTFELVAIFTPDSRHLRPMGQRTQVVLLVVAIVESQQVVKRTVVTHRVCIALRSEERRVGDKARSPCLSGHRQCTIVVDWHVALDVAWTEK